MVDLKKLQKDIYQNKVDKGFNVTDVNKEFCLTYGEVAEAYEAWRKKKDDLGEELADVAIYLLGLSEILGIDLEDELNTRHFYIDTSIFDGFSIYIFFSLLIFIFKYLFTTVINRL